MLLGILKYENKDSGKWIWTKKFVDMAFGEMDLGKYTVILKIYFYIF